MDTLHVQDEIVRHPNTTQEHTQEETAAYRPGNDLAGTSGHSNSCPIPPCYQQPPPYILSGSSTQPPYIIDPNLPARDYYYVTGGFATPESIKLSNACGFYLGVLSIAFVTASFLTFFYYVYMDTN